jgi:nucleoside-diphosphate-sugar epimerase
MTISHTNHLKPNSALILGATGGFGSELIRQMVNSHWQIRAISRKQIKPAEGASKPHRQGRIEWFVGTLDDPSSLIKAADNVDLIVHAVNVPYPKWNPLMLNYTRTIIKLAQKNNSHLLFIGNVYNAGLPSDGLITEYTPNAPINSKGEIRAQLENMILDATRNGLRATIMRFGDFFGPSVPTANWFKECTKSVLKDQLRVAGPTDLPHTWAYLPDATKACERVATIRVASPQLPDYMTLPFTGHVFSFDQLQTIIESITEKPTKVVKIPWRLLSLLGKIMPSMRDLVSMRYLWNHDIQMDGSALEHLFDHAPEHTPVKQAVLASVPGLIEVTNI